METQIVSDLQSFNKFVEFCEAPIRKPKRYPCAVLIVEHSGKGYCEDWVEATIVEAPNFTDTEQKTYLAGVIKGWETAS